MTDEERKRLCNLLRIAGYSRAAEEIERLAADNEWLREQLSGDNLRLRSEIERLADERDQFAEQLAIRSETGMAKDMQEIMRINNELSERLDDIDSSPAR